MEYKEVKIPDEILGKLDDAATNGQPITFGEAGIYEWLTKLSKSEGWRVVWQATRLPFFTLEREDKA